MIKVPRIDMLFKCKHYIVVNKPPGLYSQPGMEGQVTVLMALKSQYPELFEAKQPFCAPKTVHRLDAETTGCMAYGISDYGVKMLTRGLKYHDKGRGFQMQKWYAAILDGPAYQIKRNAPPDVNWDSEWSGTILRRVYDKPAITRFLISPSQPRPDTTLAFFNLLTGRKHQIRKHCVDALHPIVGESRFDISAKPGSQLALHSWRLIVKGYSESNNCDTIAPVYSKSLWQPYVNDQGYIMHPYCQMPDREVLKL
ncbi:21S rRNA pseudouridine(2819) synthase [Trichomonascus vanleenenianus]|uniref:pseudouridine synthase PUS5 n=1 Tax=Trichomonascus vanleenenianus TaxID=2268995 RepID=UPI003ECB8FF2